MSEELECCDCGLLLPRVDGPTHAYLGATAGCWALYNELHAKQLQGFGALSPIRVIDAYAVQHPGKPERRAIQSVNAHLVALYLQLEKGYTEQQVNVALQRVLRYADEFVWLDPPKEKYALTVAGILQFAQHHADAAQPSRNDARAETAEEEAQVIREYAEGVWFAWRAHRAAVEKWAAKVNG
jgi:Family of unknown function (DUF5946)